VLLHRDLEQVAPFVDSPARVVGLGSLKFYGFVTDITSWQIGHGECHKTLRSTKPLTARRSQCHSQFQVSPTPVEVVTSLPESAPLRLLVPRLFLAGPEPESRYKTLLF
jgi:hypothetical protein